MNKFLDFFEFGNPKFGSKNWEIWELLPFDINQFRRFDFRIFNFYFRNFRNFGKSISIFEASAILKFSFSKLIFIQKLKY